MLTNVARSIFLAVFAPLAAGGCVATAGVDSAVVYEDPVTVVEAPPVAIETYPRIYYHGSYAYLVGSRWYYHEPRGWVVFRREPVELGRYRAWHAGYRHYEPRARHGHS